jgi:hypothetical protein
MSIRRALGSSATATFFYLTFLTSGYASNTSVPPDGYGIFEVATVSALGLDSIACSQGGPFGNDLYFVDENGSLYSVPPMGGTATFMFPIITPHTQIEFEPGGNLFAVLSGSGTVREYDVLGNIVNTTSGMTWSEGLEYVESGPYQGQFLVTDYWNRDLSTFVPGDSIASQVYDLVSLGPLGVDVPSAASSFAIGSVFCSTASPGRDLYEIAGGSHSLLSANAGESIAFPPDTSIFGDYLYYFVSTTIDRVDSVGQVEVFSSGFSNSTASSEIEFSPDGRHLFVAGDNESTVYRISPVDLDLRITPLAVSAGDPVCFDTSRGKPGGLAMLRITGIAGVPASVNITIGTFDASGLWTLSGTTPSGLPSLGLTLESLGILPDGSIGTSNPACLTLQ